MSRMGAADEADGWCELLVQMQFDSMNRGWYTGFWALVFFFFFCSVSFWGLGLRSIGCPRVERWKF